MNLDCRYSPFLYYSLILLHLLALGASLLAIPWLLPCLMLSTAITASALRLRREFSLAGSKRIHTCQINARESLLLSQQGTTRCGPPSVIYWSEFLLVLRFRVVSQPADIEHPRPKTLLLGPESLSDADHGKLRSHLRFSESL